MNKFMKKTCALALALVTAVASFAMVATMDVEAASYSACFNSAQVATQVFKGYNNGAYGPVTITKVKWNNRYAGYLVTLSGTETVANQSTGYWTDALAGFNLNNAYQSNVVNIINWNIPRGSRIFLAGHSLGGMIAQQVAANSTIKNNYQVVNTVCFGSPLLAAGSREGSVYRLGDTSDVVPYLSGSTINNTAWAICGLNRENGGYGNQVVKAHCESYLRQDVWGNYDAFGKKNGGNYLILETSSTRFFKSPTSVK